MDERILCGRSRRNVRKHLNTLAKVGSLWQRRPSPRGRLAQLVEHLVYTERVSGSSPLAPTIFQSCPEK